MTAPAEAEVKTISRTTQIYKWDDEAGETVFDKDIVMHLAQPALIAEPGTVQGTPAEIARLVLKQVENHPATFYMGGWAVPKAEHEELMESANAAELIEDYLGKNFLPGVNLAEDNACGTTLCVAGYVQLFTKGEVDEDTVEEDAAAALGLDVHNAANLFYNNAETAVRTLQEIADGSFKPEPYTPDFWERVALI